MCVWDSGLRLSMQQFQLGTFNYNIKQATECLFNLILQPFDVNTDLKIISRDHYFL